MTMTTEQARLWAFFLLGLAVAFVAFETGSVIVACIGSFGALGAAARLLVTKGPDDER